MIDEKIKSLPELQRVLGSCENQSKKIVFTNGCFDILHAGHVQYLEEAKGLGDLLVVGLNSDRSVRALKGPNRPINTQTARAVVLAGLSSVDYVTIFNESDPLELILALKPHFLVKGDDWPLDEIVGKKEVESYGGEVKTIPYISGYSTTEILTKIRSLEIYSQ